GAMEVTDPSPREIARDALGGPLPITTGVVGENAGRLRGWLAIPGFMLLPALLLMLIFLVWPAIGAFKVALESWTGFSPASRFVGLDNFALMGTDRNFGFSL